MYVRQCFRCFPALPHHSSRMKMPLEALQTPSTTKTQFAFPFTTFFYVIFIRCLHLISTIANCSITIHSIKLNCYVPPIFLEQKIMWNQSLWIIFVLDHIWYLSTYCERNIVKAYVLTDDEEFVKDGFTTSSGPMRTRPNTTFIFSKDNQTLLSFSLCVSTLLKKPDWTNMHSSFQWLKTWLYY